MSLSLTHVSVTGLVWLTTDVVVTMDHERDRN